MPDTDGPRPDAADAGRHRLVKEVFSHALELREADRAGFLHAACGSDHQLRDEVESLLRLGREHTALLFRADVGAAGSASLDGAALIGKRIGQYEVRRLIATGGMGSVYEAIQERPRRIVALKIMRHGFSSQASRRRFEYEAEILARLRDPGIAQIYDAGAHEDFETPGTSIPYFAMEYIPNALSITRYAENHQLGIRDRLELLVKTCDAVQHGHSRGVIHRDLKPANLLIDTGGQPKVIDFGVARATGSDLAVATVQTTTGELLGTVQYMSPEQCVADPHDVDVRSDVYSLGVVAYELLTGQPPYDVAGNPLPTATRLVIEATPKRPSTITSGLRGDIETILLKALEKDRERRYSSAGELGAEFRRYLSGEAILAQPPAVMYQLRLLARRHKTAFGAAIAVITMFVAAFVITAAMAGIARRESLRSQRQEQIARAGLLGATYARAQAALEAADVATAGRELNAVPEGDRGWEWNHFNSRLHQSLATLVNLRTQGGGQLGKLAANAEFAVSTTDAEDGSAIIVSLHNPESQWSLKGSFHHPSVSLHPTQPLLALAPSSVTKAGPAGYGLTYEVYDISQPSSPELIASCDGFPGPINALAFDPQRPILASGSIDGSVMLWSLDELAQAAPESPLSPSRLSTIRGFELSLLDLEFSPVDGVLAACGYDNEIRLWDTSDPVHPKELAILRGHEQSVIGLAFDAQGERLASASIDGTVRLWDVASVRNQHRFSGVVVDARSTDTLPAQAGGARTVAFSPDGQWLAAGGVEPVVLLWEVAEHTRHWNWPPRQNWTGRRHTLISRMIGHSDIIDGIAFTQDGRLLSSSRDGTMREWPVAPTDPVPTLSGHAGSVVDATFSPDGEIIASASSNGEVRLWSASEASPTGAIPGVARGVLAVQIFAHDERKLLAYGTEDAKAGDPTGLVAPAELWLWDITDPQTPTQIADAVFADQTIRALAVSPGGSVILSGHDGGLVRRWDITDPATPSPIGQPIAADSSQILDLAYFTDGSAFATIGKDEVVRLWDAQTGTALGDAPVGQPSDSLAISPDDKTAAIGGSDGVIRLFDISVPRSPVPLAELPGHNGTVRSLDFSPSGDRLASGSADRTVRLWDPLLLRPTATLRGHLGPVLSVQFSSGPNPRLLSSSNGDEGRGTTVMLWEPSVSEQTRRRRAATALAGHLGRRYMTDLWWERPRTRDELIGILVSDPELDVLAKRGAQTRLDELWSTSFYLQEIAWSAVARPGRDAGVYAAARDLAERALAFESPSDEIPRSTPLLGRCQAALVLALAEYRCNDPETALATLQICDAPEDWPLPDHWLRWGPAVTATRCLALLQSGRRLEATALWQSCTEAFPLVEVTRQDYYELLREAGTQLGEPQ